MFLNKLSRQKKMHLKLKKLEKRKEIQNKNHIRMNSVMFSTHYTCKKPYLKS